MASLLLIYKNHPNRRAWFRANRGGLMKTNTEGKGSLMGTVMMVLHVGDASSSYYILYI